LGDYAGSYAGDGRERLCG
jgi:hypothetical protein